MANNTIDIVSGDNKTELQFTLKDKTGVAVNISGFSIKFLIRKQGASTNTNTSNNDCTIVTAASGIFKYTFATGDIPTSGTYLGQLQITFSDSKIHKVPVFLRINGIESYI